MRRCRWADKSPLLLSYHDEEWGTPTRDDRALFELLALETFQAGLSWETVLKKREELRKSFHNFDPEKVASMKAGEIEALLKNPRIIRNRRKVEGTVANARAFLKVAERWGSFSEFLWSLTDGKTVASGWKRDDEVPPYNDFSAAVSTRLRELGFVLVGPTVTHSFLQATGVINDHLIFCFRYGEIVSLWPTRRDFPRIVE